MILYMHRTGFEMNAFTENIFEYPLIGFEKSTLYRQVLMNTEMALKYDRYNILANTIELYLTFHDWILDPYSPLNTRKALVKINDFRNKYPGHYLFDLISGQYEIAKNVIGLSNDKIKAIEHFKLVVEKTKNIYHDDLISRFGFGYYCNFLIRIFENNPNAFISDIIYYQSLMYDYKLSLGDNSIIHLLENQNWLMLLDYSIKVGDYSTVIDKLIRLKEKTNNLYITNNNIELKIVDYQFDLILAICFFQLNDLETSSDILQKIDISGLSNIAKNIEIFSFIEPQEWSEWVPVYHTIMAENHLKNKEYKSALSHRKWILDSKSWYIQKHYKMESHSYLAHYYATTNEFSKAKRHIESCLSIYNETYKEGNVEFNSKVNFFFHLIMSSKILGDDEGFKKYLEIILADIDKMSNRLNFNHKKMFLDRYPINKIMELKI